MIALTRDHGDAWNVANSKKETSNLARCYIDAIGLIWATHGKGCICVFCVVPTSEASQAIKEINP